MEFLLKRVQRLSEGLQTAFYFKTYWLLAIVAIVAFAWAFVKFTSIPGQSFAGWLYSVPDTTKAFIIIAAILTGLTITLQIFALRNLRTSTRNKAKSAGSGIAALAAGLVSVACCSPLLIPFVAFSGAISFVLFNQPYFIALSTLLLVVALYYSAKPIACSDCRVKLGVELNSEALPERN